MVLSRHFFLTVTIAAALCACKKEDNNNDPQPDPNNPTAHLVGINLIKDYTPSEFVTKLSNCTYASWIGLEDYTTPVFSAYIAAREPVLNMLFLDETGSFTPDIWKVRQINFDYRTVDVKGDSVTLSAAMCYVDNTLGKTGHALSSISLVCHTYEKFNTDCPTIAGDITMGRALWNSLVVLPDMQGYGTSVGMEDGMKMSMNSVNQIVDCERVAIKLAQSQGVVFDENYYTMVLGYSLACGPMMGVARWMEECSQEDKALFRYKSALVGGGLYNYFEWCEDFYRNKASTNTSINFSVMTPVIPYLVKSKDLQGYKPEDFFSPEFTTPLATINGHATCPATVTLWKYDNTEENINLQNAVYAYYYEPGAYANTFASDMSTDTLILDPSTPKTKILKELCDKQVAYYGWTPTHRVTIFNPDNDEMVPASTARNAYNTLKANGGGSNLNLEIYTVPEIPETSLSNHMIGTAVAQIRMLIMEDPTEPLTTNIMGIILQPSDN